MPVVSDWKLPTIPSSNFFSLLTSWACLGSFQRSGFSTSRLTSSSLRALRSTSKIPPKFDETVSQVFDEILNKVDAFDFHGSNPIRFALTSTLESPKIRQAWKNRIKYYKSPDLAVLEGEGFFWLLNFLDMSAFFNCFDLQLQLASPHVFIDVGAVG